jgi:hypothetical protein
MLQSNKNNTYTAIHYFVSARSRQPNVAVYTGSGAQWILGLRGSVSIDPRKYPEEAELAEKSRIGLVRAIAKLPRAAVQETEWDRIPEALRARFMRANDDDFADNYQWYLMNVSPEVLAQEEIRVSIR